MIEETVVLKNLMFKPNYLSYRKFLKSLELEQENKVLLETIGNYFQEYPEVSEINLNEFKVYFNLRNPTLKKKDTILNILESLNEIPVNDKLLKESLSNLIERHYSAELINTLIPVLDGTKSNVLLDALDVVESYEKATTNLREEETDARKVTASIADIIREQVLSSGLKWRLHCLNHDIGDLHGTSLGHVFARVDTGKTSFIASEAAHMAAQLKPGEEIWWYNNEEDGAKVKLRVASAVCGMSKAEMAKDPEKAQKIFESRNGNHIVIVDKADVSVEEMERDLMDNPQIKLVIIDQGDKVRFKGKGNHSTVDALKILYGKFRELQKKFKKDIITIGQADSTAEGKKWLRLTNMDYSKTGKPGELDWAVGIGVDFNGPDYARYICVCKNKMKDGNHGRYQVCLDAMIAQYKDNPIRRGGDESTFLPAVGRPVSQIPYDGVEETSGEAPTGAEGTSARVEGTESPRSSIAHSERDTRESLF